MGVFVLEDRIIKVAPHPSHHLRPMNATWARHAGDQYCYLTTTGRVTGRPHRIEIWFAIDGRTLYVLSGGRDRSDWVRNLRKTPEVSVQIGERIFAGRARVIEDDAEDRRARRLVHDKYAPGYAGDLESWRRSSLPIAVDLVD